MVVVLPEPLTPTTSTTKGFSPPTASGCATGVRTFSTSAATTAFTSSGRDRLVVAALADRGGDFRRAVDAEIGADQHLLDLVEHLLVELALDHEIGDGAADRRRRALEPAAQPLPPALLLFRLIVHRLSERFTFAHKDGRDSGFPEPW